MEGSELMIWALLTWWDSYPARAAETPKFHTHIFEDQVEDFIHHSHP